MSIFKDTFKQYVKDQLKTREEARNKDGRLQSKNIQYLNSKTGWIRLTSSVNVDPNSELARKLGLKDNALAKKYILQGGTLYEKNNGLALRRGIGSKGGAYGDKLLGGPNENWKKGGREELGIRPMPGINSISVKSKTAYGSLREGIINLTAWSVSQLEELELLYMRPGYAVLLEWGSSLYLDNSASLTNNSLYINIIDVLNNKLSKNDIYKEIAKNQENSSGNYDAMFGLVQNFSWSSRQDGGYDCIINIISIGEVIESLKVNYVTTNGNLILDNINKLTESNKTEIVKQYKLNKLKGTLLFLNQQLLELGGGPVGKYSIFLNSINNTITTEYLNINFNFSTTSNNLSTSPPLNQIYIPLKFLIAILNDSIVPYDIKHNEPYIKLSVDDDDGKPLECFSFYRQVSVDPRVCLITPIVPNVIGQYFGPNFLKDVSKEFQYFNKDSSKNGNRGIIGNIFLNINRLIEIFDNLFSQDEKGIVDLYSFLREIMSQVQKSTGNINNFELYADGIKDVIKIIDIKYLDNEEISAIDTYTLKVFGTETTVRNYSLQSSIFPSMAAMIAISAQNVGGILGYDNGTFVKFNEGLINRITPEVGESGTGENNTQNSTTFSTFRGNVAIPNVSGSLISSIYFSNNETNKKPIDLNKESAINAFSENISLMTQFFQALNSFKNVATDKIETLQAALHDIIYYEINNTENSKSNYKGIMPLKLSVTLDGISGIVIGQIFKIPEDRLPLGYKSTGNFKVGFIVTGISQEVQNNDWVTVLETQTCMLKT